MKFILTLFLSIFFILPGASLAATPGEQAFSFEGTAQDGTIYKLEDLKGQRVILEWYNRDCPFVRKFYNVGEMQRLQEKHADHAVWLTVVSSREGTQGHMNPEDTTKNMKKEEMKSKAVIIDESGVIGKAFDARTTPQIVIIDEEGVIRYNGAIDSISSANSDDIEKARNYLNLAMAELVEGKEVTINRTNPYGCSVKY